jgi:hypothetical protein
MTCGEDNDITILSARGASGPIICCQQPVAASIDFEYQRPCAAPVAQLDRVPDSESGGHRFESCRVRQ